MIENETNQLLTEIRDLLRQLVEVQTKPAIRQEWFTTREAAELAKVHGKKGFGMWTLQQACNTERIKARKNQKGVWLIHQSTLEKIFNEGMPA